MIMTGWEVQRSTQYREGFRRNQQCDAARGTGGTADEAAAFQGEDHLMHGRSGDFEEVAEVRFGRWSAIKFGVRIDESQVLTLRLSEQRMHGG